MIGSTNFEPPSSEMLPVPSPLAKDFILFLSRPVLQEIVLNYNVLNFITKNVVQCCFLSSLYEYLYHIFNVSSYSFRLFRCLHNGHGA